MRLRDQIDMSPGWKKILGTKEGALGLARLGMQNQNKGLEIFPGLFTDSPEILKIHEKWHKRLSTPEWTSSDKASLLPKDWDALLARGGYVMSPTAIGMENNFHLLKELPKDFIHPDDEVIFRELVHEMFGCYKLVPMSFKKSSSTGYPTFIPDVDLKAQLWEEGINILHANKGRSLAPSAFLNYGMPCVYFTGRRTQPEGAKQRDVWTGYEFVPSSKDIGIDGFHAMRFRLVYGGSGKANYSINSIFTCIRAYYYDHFEKTYKVRFADDIVDRFSKFSAHQTIDVSSYDTTIQEWHFDKLLKVLQEDELLDPVVVSLLRAMLGGPSASQSPYPLDKGIKWPLVGDPLDDSTYRMTKGLMSGIATVSDFGRFFMTWNLLSCLHRVTGDVIGNVGRYLRHQMPLAAFCNSSDDNFMGCVSQELMKRWMFEIEKKGYFLAKPEDQLVYLGTQYYFEGGRMKHAPNLKSYLVKWNCPEHGIWNTYKSPNRKHWQDGWFLRNKMYDSHPLFRDLYHMVDEDFKAVTKDTMRESIKSGSQYEDQIIAATEADRIFIDNPDAIHYKININDVSPELLAGEFGSIVSERIQRAIEPLFGSKMRLYS